MNVLFLKVHVDAESLELPDRLQQGDGVPGKAGDRLGDDGVCLSRRFDTIKR